MTRARGWTTSGELRSQVEKLWERGDLGRAVISAAIGPAPTGDGDGLRETTFPLRLTLRRPTARELSERFDEARAWIDDLDATPGIRIERRRVKHRVLGANDLPAEARVQTLDDALAVAGCRTEAAALEDLARATAARRPALISWLRLRPRLGVEHAGVWEQLLDVVDWIERHPNPGVYLRQVDLPGTDTKLIETHRRVLAELIDLSVPSAVVEPAATGIRGFERRYGFRSKPNLVRFRILDPDRQLAGLAGRDGPSAPPPAFGAEPSTVVAPPADVTVDAATFARLDPDVGTVFFVENEINYLVFPELADAMVIWVAGFGTERLATADWLTSRSLRYWGDIDTHGFAILDELRRRFAAVESFLMDRQTLLDHRSRWVVESEQETRDLPRLTAAEVALYDDLRRNHLGQYVRLEQERIRYSHVQAAIEGSPHGGSDRGDAPVRQRPTR